MSNRFDGCGLAYAGGYDPELFIEEELDDDEINDSEGHEDDWEDYEYENEFEYEEYPEDNDW